MFDKRPCDLSEGDVVVAFGVLGGPFEVIDIYDVKDVPGFRTVSMKDSAGCTINATAAMWDDKGFRISDSEIGRFQGYDQELVKNGKKLLQGAA